MNCEVIILDGTLSNILLFHHEEFGYVFPGYNESDCIGKTIEDFLEETTGVRLNNYKHNISSINKNSNGFVYVIQLFEYTNNIFINSLSSWYSLSDLIQYINQNGDSCQHCFLDNIYYLKKIYNLSQQSS